MGGQFAPDDCRREGNRFDSKGGLQKNWEIQCWRSIHAILALSHLRIALAPVGQFIGPKRPKWTITAHSWAEFAPPISHW